METRQTANNQEGEIQFRRKLVRQQVEGEVVLDDEYSSDEIAGILRDRMSNTLDTMRELQASGICLSPFVEIGAERGQRAMVMESDLGLHGAAVDISFDMLKSCDHYSRLFNRDKLPLRICADLYNAPFMSNSVPFIFCYQTLHHFPDSKPIINGMHRILQPGGSFYFAEEPFKRGFHLPLYKSSRNFSLQHRKRNKVKRFLDHLFAEEICNEVDHGVVENDDIPIKHWREVFRIFVRREIRISSLSVSSDLFRPESLLRYGLNWFWGGEVSGLCRKDGDFVENRRSIEDALACVKCLLDGQEILLKQDKKSMDCPICGSVYPIRDGVVFLMTPEKRRALYPEIRD